MSEFTNNKEKRLEKLLEISKLILEETNPHKFILEHTDFIEAVIPADFINLFDTLIKEGYPIEKLKILSNKILNIFQQPIENFSKLKPKPDSFLAILEHNNQEMEQVLDNIRPVFKKFVKDSNNSSLKKELLILFNRLELFIKQYTIKENILFPIIEKHWDDYRCLQIMWSFHDDIRRNLKKVKEHLLNSNFNLSEFNKSVGVIFFNMLAIKFRDENILFPYILSTIPEAELDQIKNDGIEIGFPYIQPQKTIRQNGQNEQKNELINLATGELSVEQIKLIFNHLPVDITYVDENDEVRYFSTPTKRIFPRTTAIIGRKVNNCHPPESVHIVEKIIRSFKSGEKDKADFWIKMANDFILIQYFAIRDSEKNYRGVIEVSQEISEIKNLDGEKRLLDW